jgi:hypothetical protein
MTNRSDPVACILPAQLCHLREACWRNSICVSIKVDFVILERSKPVVGDPIFLAEGIFGDRRATGALGD